MSNNIVWIGPNAQGGLPISDKNPRGEIVTQKDRRNFLHKMLGGVCHTCGVSAREALMNIHHIFYPLGYSPNWYLDWRRAKADIFWSSYFPEIMEACVLLCRGCHKKVHGREPLST